MWIVVGIVQANSIALSKIATLVPGNAEAESRVTTIRRRLKNYRIAVWQLYRPIARPDSHPVARVEFGDSANSGGLQLDGG